MSSARPTSWLSVAALAVPLALGLGWWLLGFGRQDQRGLAVPDGMTATLEFISVADHGLSVDAVERLPAGDWQPMKEPGNLGAAPHEVLWTRVVLRNPAARPVHGVLASDYFFTDTLDLWRREAGGWATLRTGEAAAASVKVIGGRDLAFPVEVEAGGTSTIYLRAEDFFRPFLRLTWWPDGLAYHEAKARRLLVEGVYFGALFALLGYNALLWLRLRQQDIGDYVCYVAASGAFVVLARGVLPATGVPLSSPALETVMTLAVALSGFFLARFTRRFLELAERMPKADRLARALGWVLLGLAVGSALTPWLPRPTWLLLTIGVNAAAHLTWCVVALGAWRAGAWQARFFIASFGFLFAGSIAATLAWWWRWPPATALAGMMLGSMLEMLLLSLAVAERFARAQREKMAAQQKLVEETEQRRLVEETYADELEIEVRERTRELEEASADKDRMLAVIGHDLRGPLTGLMRGADEATGEFARKTAGTGRALLLMIEDLVLWARLRAGPQAFKEHSARALLAPAVALHHALAEQGGTELIVSAPGDLRVTTDLVLAQTLVRNLLANALKFARTRVTLRAEANASGGVRISVGNDGPALAPEIAARLAADEDGPMTATSGLGLRLCREICRALGLKLEARTAPDGGTEFGFTLAAAPSAAAAPRSP